MSLFDQLRVKAKEKSRERRYGVWLVPVEPGSCRRVLHTPTSRVPALHVPFLHVPVAHDRTRKEAEKLAAAINRACPGIQGSILNTGFKDGYLFDRKYAGHVAVGFRCRIQQFATIARLARDRPFSQTLVPFVPVRYENSVLARSKKGHNDLAFESLCLDWIAVPADLSSPDPNQFHELGQGMPDGRNCLAILPVSKS